MKYTQEDIELIRRHYDSRLLETVNAFVTMKKKTPHTWEGICPSCGGKHFQVSEKPDGQIYKCWNCNEGGKSAIKFLMQLKGMSFEEALDEIVHLFCVPVKTKEGKREERARPSNAVKCRKDRGQADLLRGDVGRIRTDVQGCYGEGIQVGQQGQYL